MRTVLLVDDNTTLSRYTRAFILARVSDVQVLLAHDIATARRLFTSTVADLVIVDVELPDRSGVELARAFAADKPGTVLALISGETPRRPEVEALEKLGLAGWLSKPYTADEVVELVLRALSARNTAPQSTAPTERGTSVVRLNPNAIRRELESIQRALAEVHDSIAQATTERDILDIVDTRVEPIINSVRDISRASLASPRLTNNR